MAFFDKLNDFAKNIGDKTTDAIETGKLNSRINSERNAAGEELKKIGEHYYNVFAAGGQVAPEVLEFCQGAKTHYDAAGEAQAEIDRIRAENEAAKAAAAAPVQAAPAGITCPGCGTVNGAGIKFCQNCGSKLEAPPPAPAGVTCPGCGTANTPGTKFCAQCGTKLEVPAPAPAPAPRLCPGCGAEVPDGTRFCPQCGQRMDQPAAEPVAAEEPEPQEAEAAEEPAGQ